MSSNSNNQGLAATVYTLDLTNNGGAAYNGTDPGTASNIVYEPALLGAGGAPSVISIYAVQNLGTSEADVTCNFGSSGHIRPGEAIIGALGFLAFGGSPVCEGPTGAKLGMVTLRFSPGSPDRFSMNTGSSDTNTVFYLPNVLNITAP